MAELTISDLRNLETAESSLLFAVDGDTETFNLTLNTLFEYTKDRLGYLETGAIEMYMGEVIPDTHTELDGKSFDPLVFPKMGALFPAGTLPDTRGMTLKHAPDGRSVLSFEAESVKSHNHVISIDDTNLGNKTSTSDSHSHGKGTMEITASFSLRDSTSGAQLLARSGAFSIVGLGSGGSTRVQAASTSDGGTRLDFKASDAWSGLTSSDSHSHTITLGSHNHTASCSNTGGTKNLVDNIAVKFIIKKA